MTELADIVVAHGDEYLAEFGARMPRNHVRALEDIRGCRTESMGGHLEECDECRHRRYSYHSCKNRSCPKCHGKDTLAWLDKRLDAKGTTADAVVREVHRRQGAAN